MSNSRRMKQHLAKRRAARRAESAGAVMFIVAMTVVVLAALGLYALRAASSEIKITGYERQSAQTHYLSEYGVLGSTQQINGTKAQLYVGLMVSMPDRGCSSLPGVPTTGTTSWGATPGPISQACRRMGSAELAGTSGSTGAFVNNVLELQPTTTTQPSLGSVPLTGDFFVEMTNPTQTTPPAGFDIKLGLCFTQITVSSTGITQPYFTSAPPETAVFGNEGLETARARVTAGPIRCSQ